MKIFETIAEIRQEIHVLRSNNHSIGFIPTMGALHHGHLALIKASKNTCDITVASIFVNPTQFNKPEDLINYPRTNSEDLKKLQDAHCDIVFTPADEEMYPAPVSLTVKLSTISNELEGKFRPGHFDGVGIVVSKLFNIIQPDQAFFGQKDIQQYFIIKELIEQLNFPIKLNMVPTVRETNGLAMSSRNMRLNNQQREDASLIYRCLKTARHSLLTKTLINDVIRYAEELFMNQERLQLEYFEVVDTKDFKQATDTTKREKIALCIAAEIGGVRLIDNLMLIS
ncbi:pantoate--beta-alanine ligase [Roseivirga sp.]|uniref:pantoate--beta-alanine ligase n=1 Tax=Roseivirga sp. TaxID=1964215 RepID=UPI003B8E7C5B